MLKKVGYLLITILVIFSLNSCGQDNLTTYCNKVNVVYEEWENVRAVTTKDYTDMEAFETASEKFLLEFEELKEYQSNNLDSIQKDIITLNKFYGITMNELQTHIDEFISGYKAGRASLENSATYLSAGVIFAEELYEYLMYANSILEKSGKSTVNINKIKIKSQDEIWTHLTIRDYSEVYTSFYDKVTDEKYGNCSTSDIVSLSAVAKDISCPGDNIFIDLYFQLSDGNIRGEREIWSISYDEMVELYSDDVIDLDAEAVFNEMKSIKDNDSVQVLVKLKEDSTFSVADFIAFIHIDSITDKRIETEEDSENEIEYESKIEEKDNSSVMYDRYIESLKAQAIVNSVEEIEDGVWVIYVNSGWDTMSIEQKQSFADSVYSELNAWSEGKYNLSATISINDTYGKTVAVSKWLADGMELK